MRVLDYNDLISQVIPLQGGNYETKLLTSYNPWHAIIGTANLVLIAFVQKIRRVQNTDRARGRLGGYRTVCRQGQPMAMYQRWKEEGETDEDVETAADDPTIHGTIPISASEERKAPAVANISSWNKVWSLFPIQLDLNSLAITVKI